MKVEVLPFRIDALDTGDTLNIGSEVQFTVTARVTMLREEQIDVTRDGGSGIETIGGEREMELVVKKVSL